MVRRAFLFFVIFLFAAPCFAGTDPYGDAGVPASSRNWQGAEYRAAAQALASGKVPLPESGKPPGGVYFDRLVSLENLELYKSASVPINARIPDWLGVAEGSNKILGMYIAANQNGRPYPTELARLQAFSLYSSATAVKLVDEFLPTLPKDDPQHEVRMGGLKKMKQGFSTQLFGSVQSLGEAGYSTKDRSIILHAIKGNLEGFKTILPPDQQKELAKTLRGLEPQFKEKSDAEALASVITMLEKK